MQLDFTQQAKGVHTAPVTADLEIAVAKMTRYGYLVTLRDKQTRAVKARLGECIRTAGEAKALAAKATEHPKFLVVLFKLAS